jgi:hypothetical protein
MIAVQVGLKRKHDRSSHEAVRCTTPYFLTRRCAFDTFRLARGEIVQAGPVKPIVNAFVHVLSSTLATAAGII